MSVHKFIESIKVGSTLRINARRKGSCLLWKPRFFGWALRSVKEYYEKVEHIHLDPVRAGLLKHAREKPRSLWNTRLRATRCPWSSVHDYSGGLSLGVSANRILAVDRILLRADERTRI